MLFIKLQYDKLHSSYLPVVSGFSRIHIVILFGDYHVLKLLCDLSLIYIYLIYLQVQMEVVVFVLFIQQVSLVSLLMVE